MKTLVLTLLLLPPAGVADVRALVVAGLGGGPEYESEFQRHARAAADALGEAADDVTLLLGDMVSRDRLKTELAGIGSRAAPGDTVVVMLIGHGSYDDRHYRFNIPSADVTGEQLGRWLDELPAKRQLVVAATSSSGALQPLLGRDGRTVITATRSGGERNATVFARYFTEALRAADADTDKDGHVSALEAFRFTEARVAGHYEERSRMATEHPVLEGPEPGMTLARLEAAPAFASGGTAEQDRLAALEAEIEALRADKANRSTDAYYAELQRLLLEVALLRRQLGEEGEP